MKILTFYDRISQFVSLKSRILFKVKEFFSTKNPRKLARQGECISLEYALTGIALYTSLATKRELLLMHILSEARAQRSGASAFCRGVYYNETLCKTHLLRITT